MNALVRAARSAPLFVQVMALMVVSLIGAQILTAAMIVTLPPPSPEVFRMTDIAQALRGRPSDRLSLSVDPVEPHAHLWGVPRRDRPFREFAARDLASLLSVPVARVRVVDVRQAPLFDPMFRFSRPDRGPAWGGAPRPAGTADVDREPGGRPGPGGPGQGGGPGGWWEPRNAILFGDFQASYQRSDGAWVTVRPRRLGLLSAWQQRVLAWLLGCVVLFAPLAYLFARRLTSPIAAFAQAAKRLGRDPRASALTLDGPDEVRLAVGAFNDMQERLRRYVDHRTAMIGAMAHDLRTPLTRMRFLLEARPEDVRDKMGREIDEMDAMIAAALAFVKDASTAGERVLLDLGAMVEALVADLAETGVAVTCTAADHVLVRGDPLALRRLFGNLLANAVKFAGGAEVSVRVEAGEAVVAVEDRGAGLDEAELDQVFEPFYRAEASRNRDTGGIGLGLAVVRSVARAHGGDATLANRPGGGLSCRVTLPIEDDAR